MRKKLIIAARRGGVGPRRLWRLVLVDRLAVSAIDRRRLCRKRRLGDQPESRGLHQGGAGSTTTRRSKRARCCSSSTTATSPPRWPRPRRRSRPRRRRRDLCQPAQSAAGDDRPGPGHGAVGRGRPDPHAARLQALRAADHHRFRQPPALRAGAGRRRKAEAEPRTSRAALAAEQSQLAVLQSQRQEEEARLLQARANLQARPKRPRQHRDPRAGLRDRRQSRRPGRPIRQARHAAVVAGAAAAGLRHRQFQGDPADPDAAGAARRDLGRRLSRPSAQGRIESFAPASGAEFSLLPPDNATGNFTKIVQRVPVRIALPREEPLRPAAAPRPVGHGHRRYPRPGDAAAGDGIVGAAEAKPAPRTPAQAQ